MNQKDDKKYKQTKLISNALSHAKPFLKWAGGKSQLLDKIKEKLPEYIKRSRIIESYIEPFIGGGAVFFCLKNFYTVNESTIIDNNRELIIGYEVIKRNPLELISELEKLEKEYKNKTEPERKIFFYEQRDSYNEQMHNFDYQKYSLGWISRAVYLIFLNRTCFNGLFRQNRKGEFNVPIGRYKNPTICNRENILQVHKALQDTTILCGDFSLAEKYVKKDSFIYFDPPYRPLNATSNFTDYSKSSFNDDEQIRLANFFKELDKQEVSLMLSNSDPKNEDLNDDFFDDLYKGFNIERIKAKRVISSKGDKRGEINELLIRNYPKDTVLE